MVVRLFVASREVFVASRRNYEITASSKVQRQKVSEDRDVWFSVIVKLEYRAQRPERPDISRSDRRPEPEAEQHSEQRAEMQ